MLEARRVHAGEHVDQAEQGAEHAEGGRERGHGAEDLRLGTLAGTHAGDAPLQQAGDVVTARAVQHQLDAGAQERVPDHVQALVGLVDLALEHQLADIDQLVQILLCIEPLVAQHDAEHLEHVAQLAERVADQGSGHGPAQHHDQAGQVEEHQHIVGGQHDGAADQAQTDENAEEGGDVHGWTQFLSVPT